MLCVLQSCVSICNVNVVDGFLTDYCIFRHIRTEIKLYPHEILTKCVPVQQIFPDSDSVNPSTDWSIINGRYFVPFSERTSTSFYDNPEWTGWMSKSYNDLSNRSLFYDLSDGGTVDIKYQTSLFHNDNQVNDG